MHEEETFLKENCSEENDTKFHDGNKFINKRNVIYKCFKRSSLVFT